MSKLLVSRLPVATEESVKPDTFNRLVRVLELNLGQFDPDNIRQINDADKNIAFFNAGSIAWNTNNESLEVYTGTYWISLSTPVKDYGFQGNSALGVVTVKTNGATSVTIAVSATGYGVEKYYT
tara:strand:+ start:20 stop:391 length:372 start_codon:yes stop_codon:yes gene_type:complete